MKAANVLLALVEAGAVLWIDEGRLCFKAPKEAVGEDLRCRAAACRPALIALVRAGGVLPASRQRWPEATVHEFEEKAGTLQFSGGLAPALAEYEAERMVRQWHARAWLARNAMLGSAGS